MSDAFSKKLSELLGKMDDKVVQAKMNAALDMLQKGNTEELAKKINKMDKDDLMKKIDDFDMSKLQGLNINMDELKQRVSDADLNKLSQLIGENGDEIMKKIRDIIK